MKLFSYLYDYLVNIHPLSPHIRFAEFPCPRATNPRTRTLLPRYMHVEGKVSAPFGR